MTPHTPRIVALIATLAILAYVNHSAPGILPAILVLLVLYAALSNVGRAQSLIGTAEGSIAGLFGK